MMTKARKLRILVLGIAALFVAIFVTFLLLSLPLGTHVAVLPITLFYIVGGTVSALFIAFAVFLLIFSKKRG